MTRRDISERNPLHILRQKPGQIIPRPFATAWSIEEAAELVAMPPTDDAESAAIAARIRECIDTDEWVSNVRGRGGARFWFFTEDRTP